ncbi:MAG: ribosome maturation factor RimP [Lachnospiraceae bacterium]|nr:ribosome maturation factor RimP [Lachnospiraceae bacterium]
MSRREEIEKKAEALVLPVLGENGARIVDTEYVKEGSDWYLRYYIDRDGGVDIVTCEKVSRAVSVLLDEADLIPDAYILEVSSPGLGRLLKKERDYDRNLGKDVDVRLYKAVDGVKELTGTLAGYTKDALTLVRDGAGTEIDRKNISRIAEHVDWDF